MEIEKLIPKFLEEFEKRSKRERDYVSLNTLKTYQLNLFRFLIFLQENKIDTNIKKITEENILQFINHLVDEQLSPATRNQIIATLKSFFKWAVKNYTIDNPVKEIKSCYQPRKEAKFFSEEDYNSFIAYLDKKGGIDQTLYRLSLQSGIRASELIQLNVEDIEFEKDRVFIKVKKGKGNKERTIPFLIVNEDGSENKENLKLYNLLKYHIKNRKREEYSDKITLFISTHKKRITYQGLRARFNKLMKKLNLQDKGYSIHSLRHTCAWKLLKKNEGNLKVLQMFLGHDDFVTTARIYSHLSIDEIAEANKF